MSRNVKPPATKKPGKPDRRVERTRDALGDALVALMQEMPFDAITVQHVLDRAGVSRSTFYTHYSDKDDLFLSDAEEFFELVAHALSQKKDKSDRVFPVAWFFDHVGQQKSFVQALTTAGKAQDVWELARGHFARGIEQRLAELPRARALSASERPVIAHGLAGSLIAMLTLWIDRGAKETPQQMEELFHRLVWAGISGR